MFCEQSPRRGADLAATAIAASDELDRDREARAATLSSANEKLQPALTEHEHARDELRISQARLSGILDSAMDAIITIDADQQITFFNGAAERMFLHAAEAVIGQPLTIVLPQRYHSAHYLHVRAFGQTNVTRRTMGALGDITGVRSDGTEFPIEASISQFDVAGQKRYTVILRDITERKHAEERLRAANARLEQSNRELQDFAYVASHDLQEPLRKIQAFGDRLQQRYGDVLEEEGRDYLERMQRAAERMQTLIDDLLTFSRVTTHPQPVVSCDLALVAREVVVDLEMRVEQTGGTIEIGDLPVIQADPLQMRQLLQNLISNALKFQVPQRAPVITVSAHIVGETQTFGTTPVCVLEVRDNGIGFDEKYLDRIFTPFQRLHGRGEYEGTGMGLAICRRIAERHGGNITATSKPGQGSVFIVRLPTAQPAR
jgi:two-component system sensor kinase FixL